MKMKMSESQTFLEVRCNSWKEGRGEEFYFSVIIGREDCPGWLFYLKNLL